MEAKNQRRHAGIHQHGTGAKMWTAAKQMYPSVLGLVQRMEGFNSQVFADFDNTTSRTAAALSAANKAAADLAQDKVKPSTYCS